MKKILILLILVAPFLNLNSQEDRYEYYSIGMYGALNFNIHSASFSEMPGFPNCCQEFTGPFGLGPNFGILFDIPTNNLLTNSGIEIRLGFSTLDAEFNDPELSKSNVLVRDPNNPENSYMVNDIDINHNINTFQSLIGIEPGFRYTILNNLNIYSGFKLAIPISSSFNQKEELLGPDGIIFDNGQLTRNEREAEEIPEINPLHFSLFLGAGYELPLSEKLYLMPEIRLFLPLISVNGTDWFANHLQTGISLKYYLIPEYEKPIKKETVYSRDTLFVQKVGIEKPYTELINTTKEIEKIEFEEEIRELTLINEEYNTFIPQEVNLVAKITGDLVDVNKFIIEETEMEEGFPLLPFVFFRQNSFDLSNANQNLLSLGDEFSEKNLVWNTMEIYKDMLNIVAERMIQRPNSKITITGCNNNEGDEKNNTELSNQRANALKSYLVNERGIEEYRIKTVARGLPSVPGNPNNPDGVVENQRAEISSDDYELLKPVYLKDVVKKSNPPEVSIIPIINSDFEENEFEYNLTVSQSGKILREYSGNQSGDILTWEIIKEPIPKLEDDIIVELNANDKFDNKASDEWNTKLEQLTLTKKRYELQDDKRIEKFALILFDFDKAELSKNQKILLEEVKDRIEPESKIIIEGYADKIGDDGYNKELSRKRANEVKKYLNVKDSQLILKAVGNDIEIYDNNSPHGRGYSRTVIVKIETPVKKM